MSNIDKLNRKDLRAACKAAGIQYSKLTVGGMREELKRLEAGTPAGKPRQEGLAKDDSRKAPAATEAKRPKGEIQTIIFTVAEKHWEKAGRPLGVPDLLKMRKGAMDDLEQNYGLKRTTCSVILGHWQAALLCS